MKNIAQIERKIGKVSIVCPFYNEAAIIGKAVERMLLKLKDLDLDWELILVNDGSKDPSVENINIPAEFGQKVRILSYPVNQGRGYALKTGIESATGDIIITTEIDLSWGEDIVEKILMKFRENSKLDAVIASPNLPGGGYKNVPFKRVILSKFGNQLIRLLFTRKITMNTGMTRGYRREVIQGLSTFEKGKEFHLEVLLKLHVLGASIGEIPATLEWKDQKLSQTPGEKRKSSTKIPHIIATHVNFLFFASPIKYFWFISIVLMALCLASLAYGTYLFMTKGVSVFMVIISMLFAIFSLLFFGFGVIAELCKNILKELWKNNRG